MAPHRILFVEASVGGVLGGSLTGILQLIDRLDRTRFAPALLLYQEKEVVPQLEAAGVPVAVLPPQPGWLPDGDRGRGGRAWLRAKEIPTVVLPRARAVGAHLRRARPDVVYLANGVTPNLDALVAAARAGIPALVHEKGYRRIGPRERFMSRWIDVFVGMTDLVTAHAKRRGIRARRHLTVYDGIDCERFAPGGGAAVRRELGVPAEAPVVGIVGHIQGWKGQDLVVQAMARLRDRHPELRCLIVGGVHRQGGAYAERLRRRIVDERLERRVLLTGARRDVAACIDAMDVAIHSSTNPEPFGRVLIEAMALSCPLVAPREGGPLEIVVDNETGLLVPPRDPDALAAAIERLVLDPDLRRRMGAAARARVEAVFGIRHHVRAMEAIFDEMLAHRRHATA
ncbi:MAG: glycosyltransferase family 4 protein [Deltaproteobacteria bacterium]|nr:glycosyltransferase family 4 protein [Deltaproteobacteria bacterium]